MAKRIGNICRPNNGLIVIAVIFTVCVLFAEPALAAASNQKHSNESFFSQFIVAGGPIVWFVLLPMSVVTLYSAIYLTCVIRKKILLPQNITARIATLAAEFGPAQLPSRLAESRDLVSSVVAAVISKTKITHANTDQVNRLASEILCRKGLELNRKIEWCNIIGNLAPMVGLFGTVFGMIRAFNILGISAGQPRPDQLAAAISIALITTFWGLLVAIPAIVMNSIFRNKTETILAEAALEIENLLRSIQDISTIHYTAVSQIIRDEKSKKSDLEIIDYSPRKNKKHKPAEVGSLK